LSSSYSKHKDIHSSNSYSSKLRTSLLSVCSEFRVPAPNPSPQHMDQELVLRKSQANRSSSVWDL